MSHKIFRWLASLFLAMVLSLSGFTPALAAPPANDNFANAEVITSLSFSATVDNTDATLEPDEIVSCGSSNSGTVWNSFTPAQNMAARMDMVGSVVSSAVSVYLSSGSGISNLTFLACAPSSTSVNLYLETGKTYYFQLTDSGQRGVLQFNLQQIFPPANDDFANSEAVTSLPFSATVDNTDATAEPGDPAAGRMTVWYSFTPTQNMAVRVDMVGSPTWGMVGIYRSSGSGISNLTLLGYAYSDAPANFNFEAGMTYYFEVMSNGPSGVLQLNLQQISPPANDNFANAEVITSLPFSATVDNTNATLEPGEPGACEPVNGTTVWYSFTPAQNMGVRMNMLGSSVMGIVRLRLSSGPGFSNLTFLGCMFFSGNSVDFNVEAGKTYYLQVDTNLGQTGVLHVNLQQISSGVNEVSIDIKPGNKHNRIVIASGGSASVQVAILSTADFDALTQVDKNSLTFGATGDETSLRRRFLIGTPDCRARDINHDRRKDLVCSFLIGKTGFKLGDTVGILKGKTVDDSFIEARDSVQITVSSYPSYPSYP